ncbi:MAG TPA: maleylpyruvate isomerase N-terminal domain-containing protein [Planctomycetia bacterium]|nr:maleylpyruvate isomerase N-terminal domain-containing protein [Planctomycetia bacterium]
MSMPPILVADLFPEITLRLVALLRSLSPDEWLLPTSSLRRTVKDLVSHLLDGSLRRLSIQRDGYVAPGDSGRPRPKETLVAYLDRLNDEWEVGTRRLSPRALVDLMERADFELAALFASLDPMGPAIFPVAWAGEQRSENWMDVARDYTEKWHHAQQIFDATNRPSTILNAELGRPCYETFMRALPFTFGDAIAPDGAVVTVTIAGAAGGAWHVERTPAGWRQIELPTRPPVAEAELADDFAWKIFTKRRPREEFLRRFPGIRIEGDESLGLRVLDMVAVMA